MSIQADPENIEQVRERLRKMSDLELRQYGRSARVMSDPTKHFGQQNPAFAIQLQEAAPSGVDGIPLILTRRLAIPGCPTCNLQGGAEEP